MRTAAHRNRRARALGTAGFTLLECLIAAGLLSIIGAVLLSIIVFSTRSFVALGNYADLDTKSRNALDLMSRELRDATYLLEAVSNGSTNYLYLTNAQQQTTIRISYLPEQQELVMEKTGERRRVLLTECDRWRFSLYTRAPVITATNLDFNPVDTPADCKLINMAWKCSRKILGQKVNTENVQTAQIVLRNKVE